LSHLNDISYDLLQKYNVQGPRYTSYPPAPSWKNDFGPAQYENLLKKSNEKEKPNGLSLYFHLHLPFCESLCYFCACTTVITGPNHKKESPYVDYICKEIEWLGQRIDNNRPVLQFHFGGGTPTYLSAENIEKIVKTAQKHFTFDANMEMGVEVDPRVTTLDHLKILRSVGFNRLSMGVQDFNPLVQKTINRIQPFEATNELVEQGRALGFLSINVDLIYGLPHQTSETFSKTIEQILQLNPDRLAVYSYAHVPWMKHYQEIFKDHLPDQKEKFEIFKTALRLFLEAGFDYIGMDHFAKPTDELAVARENRTLWRNFMGYTTKAGTDLLGLGMSAISSLENGFSQNEREIRPYQEEIQKGGAATLRGFELSDDDKIRGRVIMNLLCHAGVRKKDIEAEFEIDFEDYFKTALLKLKPLEQDGLVKITPDEIAPTSLGRLFLRNLAMPFDAYLPEPGKRVFSRTV